MANNPQTERWLDWYDSLDDAGKQAALAKKPVEKQMVLQEAYKEFKARPGPLDALGIHASQGMTAGHDAELEGVGALWNPKNYTKPPTQPKTLSNALRSALGLYTDTRDSRQDKIDEAAKHNPIASTVGEVGGALATAPLTGSVPGMLAYGAAAGSGYSDADLTKGEGREWAGDVGTGAEISLVGGKAGQLVGKGLAGGAASVSNSAAWRAFQAAHPELKDLRNITKQAAIKIGRRLLNEKGVRFGNSTENIADNIAPLLDDAGKQKGAAVDALDAAAGPGPIKLDDMADDIDASVRSRYAVPANRDLASDIGEEVTAIRNYQKPEQLPDLIRGAAPRPKHGVSFRTAEDKIKTPYQERGRYDSATPGRQSAAMRDVAGGAKRHIEKRAEEVSPELAQKFKDAKTRYSELAPAEEMASEATIKEARRRGLSLTDLLMANAAGAVTGNPTAAITTAAGAELLRSRGPATVAVSMDALAKALGLGAQTAPGIGSRVALETEVPEELLRKLEGKEEK